jgi:hypothetical protein
MPFRELIDCQVDHGRPALAQLVGDFVDALPKLWRRMRQEARMR